MINPRMHVRSHDYLAISDNLSECTWNWLMFNVSTFMCNVFFSTLCNFIQGCPEKNVRSEIY